MDGCMAPKSSGFSMARKRGHADMETVPGTPPLPNTADTSDTVDLTSSEDPRPSRKQRRTGPSPLFKKTTATVPRTLPMDPHDALLEELKGKYVILVATVISSSKIEKKITTVLDHLGHIDMFDPACVPGVMMLHARAGDTSKMVTVMETAKRRMGQLGQKWYQYNRVYEVAKELDDKGDNSNAISSGGDGEGGTQTVIDDTMFMDGNEEDDDNKAFEPTKSIFDVTLQPTRSLFDLTLQDKPATDTKKKNVYMSIFLSRVPMPELQDKPSFTLQTNAGEMEAGRKK